MGFFSDIGKSFNKIVDDITPDITIGDPTKLVTQPIEGVYNATGRIFGSAVSNAGEVLNQAVNSTGQILSNPNAAPLLGAAGSYFGIPNLGSIANQFGAKPSLDQGREIIPPSSPKNNTPLIIGGIVGGVAILVMTFFLFNKKKGKK